MSDTPAQVSVEEMRDQTLAHYDRVSLEAHHWSNQVPQAIRHWFECPSGFAAISGRPVAATSSPAGNEQGITDTDPEAYRDIERMAEARCRGEGCNHRRDQHSYDRTDDFGCTVFECPCIGWDPMTGEEWARAFGHPLPSSPAGNGEPPGLRDAAQDVIDGWHEGVSADRLNSRLRTLDATLHEAAIEGTRDAAAPGLRIGLDASLFPHRGAWRHAGWCAWTLGDETACTCGLDYLRRSLNYEPDDSPGIADRNATPPSDAPSGGLDPERLARLRAIEKAARETPIKSSELVAALSLNGWSDEDEWSDEDQRKAERLREERGSL